MNSRRVVHDFHEARSEAHTGSEAPAGSDVETATSPGGIRRDQPQEDTYHQRQQGWTAPRQEAPQAPYAPYPAFQQPFQPSGDNVLIDLPLLWAIFRRRLGLFLGGAITVLALVMIFTWQITPKYAAHATVVIDSRQKQVLDYSAMISGLPADSASVDTEVQLIKSRAIAERVTEKLGLYNDPEFNPAAAGETKPAGGIKGFIKGLMPGQVEKDAVDPQLAERLEQEGTVNAVMGKLSATRSGLTYMIDIGYVSTNPAKAAEIANAFADQYLVHQLEAKFDFIQRNRDTLNEKRAQYQDEVRAAEAKVEAYREANGLFESEGASLTEQQISDLNAQLIAQRADLAEARARLNAVRNEIDNGRSADTITEVLGSQVISQLRAEMASLSRRKSELATRYGPEWPEMQKIEREESDLQNQIEQEITRIVSSIQNEVEIARQRVLALEESLSGMRGELATNNKALVELRELEREAEATREFYEQILSRTKQVSEQEALTEADASIASLAAIPRAPAYPNKSLNMMLGLIMGGAFGLFLIVLAEVFDNGIRTGDDIERVLGTQMITTVPSISSGIFAAKAAGMKPEDYLVERPMSAFAEAYRTIRSNILINRDYGRPRVVALSSAVSGEGKTVSAMCLGRICAISGDKVLVIDCDVRRHILSGSVNETNAGLMEVLTGKAKLREAIQKDPRVNMHILPVSGDDPGKEDVFNTTAFRSMITMLKTKYDLIILDTAPVNAVADTRTIIDTADIAMLVVRWRKTPVRASKAAMKVLNKLKTPLLGAILTQVDTKAQGAYGYDGSYGYYATHQKYYHD
ncbi:GumC family protein [Aquisalinus flavus]|uniref:non-specific protein-tyrosine kinase n=1 Tax=Aquisalinus flavus TaxID=1526572 RepID=A0A8J2Y7C6_9PROT|nr:polysaccharide biosynthesis tyrosine autokinase [Aquisalinus flavus]MBD0425816.1 polysaccharide biosynthesis tyrosine autokinase [Aquisalinus flavus]UNE48580.1 polysaccharide biosynthesis tyrosine autokinase [Aquisalinus flavus]GGD13007.1 hypothetical protein GCM10011342_22260 [Aquisalinus flavus]